jgi:hypothetical protein
LSKEEEADEAAHENADKDTDNFLVTVGDDWLNTHLN